MTALSRWLAMVVLGVFWVVFWSWYVRPSAPDDLDAGGRFALAFAIGFPGVVLSSATVAILVWCAVRARSGAIALAWLCAVLVAYMVWSYHNLTSAGLEIDARFQAAMVLTWVAGGLLGAAHAFEHVDEYRSAW